MEKLIIVIVVFIAWIFLMKFLTRQFTRSRGFFPTLFWGVLWLVSLSFIFGGSSDNDNYDSSYDDNGIFCDPIYDQNCDGLNDYTFGGDDD